MTRLPSGNPRVHQGSWVMSSERPSRVPFWPGCKRGSDPWALTTSGHADPGTEAMYSGAQKSSSEWEGQKSEGLALGQLGPGRDLGKPVDKKLHSSQFLPRLPCLRCVASGGWSSFTSRTSDEGKWLVSNLLLVCRTQVDLHS